ncbi:MAG TPA: C25 family cysteine peptidase [bacterium]
MPDSPPFGMYPNTRYSPTISVLESDSVIRLDLLMERIPHSGSINFTGRFPGTWGELNATGLRLPRLTIYVALPGSGNPVVTFETWDDTTFQAQPASLINNNDHSHVMVGHVGIMGGVRVVPLTIRPLTYTNQASTCDVLQHAILRVAMDTTTGENPVSTPRMAFSRPWQRMFQTLVTNWEYIPNIMTGAQSHILMIVPDATGSNFLPAVADFVRWKEQRGFKVTVVPKSSMGSNVSQLAVRNRIQSEMATSDPRIDFVILVGDEGKLPVDMLYTPDPMTEFNNASDPGLYTNEAYFSAVEGTDLFPDLFLGRWVANTSQDVMKIVSRTIQHEKNSFIIDSLRFTKATVAADDQDITQWQTVARTRDIMVAHGATAVDSIYGHSHGANMISDINLGRAFVNYRGEGWDFGWYGIDFYLQDIDVLTNAGRLPIVTGIGCGTGIFNTPTDNAGFGERFMLGGTITQPYGAVGFIGPCWNTHTIFNNCLDSSIYRAWFDYGNLNLSSGLAAGKMMSWAVMSAFLIDNDVLEITNTLMRQYHVESDPSLQVFTRTPVRLQVTMPDTATFGAPSTILVNVANMSAVPAESLNVTIWMNDSTANTFWMPPAQSSMTFPINPDSTDTMTVTITGDNVLAYQKVIHLVRGTNAADPRHEAKPADLNLAQNFPNPFNPETTIEFALPKAGYVKLEVFNVLGRRVATLVQGDLNAGAHRVMWKGLMDDGSGASSGVYYCRLTTSGTTLARKMLLLR